MRTSFRSSDWICESGEGWAHVVDVVDAGCESTREETRAQGRGAARRRARRCAQRGGEAAARASR